MSPTRGESFRIVSLSPGMDTSDPGYIELTRILRSALEQQGFRYAANGERASLAFTVMEAWPVSNAVRQQSVQRVVSTTQTSPMTTVRTTGTSSPATYVAAGNQFRHTGFREPTPVPVFSRRMLYFNAFRPAPDEPEGRRRVFRATAVAEGEWRSLTNLRAALVLCVTGELMSASPVRQTYKFQQDDPRLQAVIPKD